MHKTGPITNSGVSKFVKLVAVYTKHQQLNNTKNYLSLHTIHYLKLNMRSNNNTLRINPFMALGTLGAHLAASSAVGRPCTSSTSVRPCRRSVASVWLTRQERCASGWTLITRNALGINGVRAFYLYIYFF